MKSSRFGGIYGCAAELTLACSDRLPVSVLAAAQASLRCLTDVRSPASERLVDIRDDGQEVLGVGCMRMPYDFQLLSSLHAAMRADTLVLMLTL